MSDDDGGQMSLGEIVSPPAVRASRKSARSTPASEVTATEAAPPKVEPATDAPPADKQPTAEPAREATQQPAAEDDIWADPPEGESIPRGVYVATRKKMRDKLQQLERDHAKAQGELEALRRGQLAPPTPPSVAQPKVMTREDLEAEYFRDPLGYQERQIARIQGEIRKQQYASSEAILRTQHQDVDAALGAFVEAARANPGLVQQFQNHPNPAAFAYEFGKQIMAVPEGVATIGDMEKHLRAKIKAEVEEEHRRQNALTAAQTIQPSSAGAPGSSASPVAEPEESGFGFLPTRWA